MATKNTIKRVRLNQPLANVKTGHTATGKFAPGNQVAKGRRNPHAAVVASLRRAFLNAVSPKMVRAVVKVLHREAVRGNVKAANVLLSYSLGPPVPLDVMERLEALEATIDEGDTP